MIVFQVITAQTSGCNLIKAGSNVSHISLKISLLLRGPSSKMKVIDFADALVFELAVNNRTFGVFCLWSRRFRVREAGLPST